MNNGLFSPMAIDALGEMMNISLGSSATAISNMLDHRVDITTPRVSIVEIDQFTLGDMNPALGVEIKYVDGLQGSNIMLLKRNDIKVIVELLMGTEIPDEEFELNDLTISAVCELMNQMMGAASTAMSDFLGYPVNISTPEPFELNDLEAFKSGHLPQDTDCLVIVRFSLKIENILESEFMNVMSVSLARELLAGLGLEGDEDAGQILSAAPVQAPPPAVLSEPVAKQESDTGGGKLSQEEIEKLMHSVANEEQMPAAQANSQQPELARAPNPAPAAQQQAAPAPQSAPPGEPFAGGYMGAPPQQYPPQAAPPKLINARPLEVQPLSASQVLGKEQAENLELIMGVPLQVTVEIGRTRRKVQDILQFSKGALVVLDKLAGDQVDLFVNGKCIARGDVVVVDDNFGVRITEIVQKPTIEGMTF